MWSRLNEGAVNYLDGINELKSRIIWNDSLKSLKWIVWHRQMDRFVSADIRSSHSTFLLVSNTEAHPRPIALANEILWRHMKLSEDAPRRAVTKTSGIWSVQVKV